MVKRISKTGLGVIEFNDSDSKVNVLSAVNLDKLESILTETSLNPNGVKAVFFISAKKDIFIAGADIKELASIRTKESALRLCAKGQAICNRIEQLPFTTFAVVDGACIGGGLELALSCDYILATANRKTRIGFPEARLKISPGFGGVHRLKERIGVKKAARLIETGQLLSGREAKKTGIVDRLISERTASDYKKLSGFAGWRKRSIPEARHEFDIQEREALAEKIVQAPAKNALSAFLMVTKYKNHTLAEDDAEHGLKSCAIIGAGTMGRDIAYLVSSTTRLTVNIIDVNEIVLKNARIYIDSIYREAVKKDILARNEARKGRDRISFNKSGLEDCDIVIECVPEDLQLKKQVFLDIEKKLKPDCVIASNTSCLSIEELGRSLTRPGRFIGAHFFNPAYKMKLVEVARAGFTDSITTNKIRGFLQAMRRTPVMVKDSPGFLINRMLLPYLNEAAFMIEEGFSSRDIDSAMVDFGMPEGPIELIKDIGMDTTYKASMVLRDRCGSRIKVAESLKSWTETKKISSGKTVKQAENNTIVQRLLEPMKREAELCASEGVADNQEVIDLALLLGAGFPASKRIWDT